MQIENSSVPAGCGSVSPLPPLQTSKSTAKPSRDLDNLLLTCHEQLATLLPNEDDKIYAVIEQQTKLFLTALFEPEHTIEYRRKSCWNINQKSQKPFCFASYHQVGDLLTNPDTLRAYAKQLHKNICEGYHAYLSLHTRYFDKDFFTRNGWKGPKPCGTGLDTKLYRCFALDVDDTAATELPGFLREHQLPEPTLTVVTGYGLQLYWRLDRAISRSNGEALFKAFVEKHSRSDTSIASDNAVKSAAQIVRHPGTVNQVKISDGKIRDAAWAYIVTKASSGEFHSIHDLLPGRRKEIEKLYSNDAEALTRQETFWHKIRNQPWQKRVSDVRGRGGKQPPPLSTVADFDSFERTHSAPLLLSLPLVGLKKGDRRAESVVEFIIHSVQVLNPGERHSRPPFLIAKIRYFFGMDQDQPFLNDIHDRWYRLCEVRKRYKTVNLGVLYGQTEIGIAGRLGISREDARALLVWLCDFLFLLPSVNERGNLIGPHLRIVQARKIWHWIQ